MDVTISWEQSSQNACPFKNNLTGVNYILSRRERDDGFFWPTIACGGTEQKSEVTLGLLCRIWWYQFQKTFQTLLYIMDFYSIHNCWIFFFEWEGIVAKMCTI